jgi:DNA adenine methylase
MPDTLPPRKVFVPTADGRSALAPRPFVKWAGGKAQLLDAFLPLYPEPGSFRAYLEPFVGGGAVFFHVQTLLRPDQVLLCDTNAELISTYEVVRDDVDELIGRLREHQRKNDDEYFYEVREQNPAKLEKVARAARLIYLNKTCFNGLYRVNSRGLFNVPWGHRHNPTIVDAEVLRAASASLQGVALRVSDFREVKDRARAGDFVYFDPPYDPVSRTAKFTSYTHSSFGPEDQRELARVYRALADRGCKVMLSNSDTPFVRELYAGFDIVDVQARRMINSNGQKRGLVGEVVVINYEAAGATDLADRAYPTAAPPTAPRTARAKAGKLGKRGAPLPG